MGTTMDQITEETRAEIAKALQSGVSTSLGLFGFDLSGVVSQVPVNTPTYDRFARESGDGSAAANWRALLNVNNAQPNPFVGLDQGGNFVQFEEANVLAPYLPVRVSGSVTRDAIALAKNYADAKAISATGTLMQWRILDNKAIIGGQSYALPAIGATTLTTATTGGSMPATTTVHVRCAARSPLNYYWGGSGIASADNTVTTGAGNTNTVTATVPAVKGAVAYDWYVAGFYVTTTIVNTATFTSIPTQNATSVPSLPDLFATPPSAVPATDTSYSAKSYTGLFAGILGDYSTNGPIVTPGTGEYSSGASFTSLDGGTLTADSQGVKEIDAMLLSIYNAAQLSPTVMIMNAQQSQDIARKVLGTNAAVTYLTPEDAARRGFDAGATVSGYINRASGGDRVEILVDPHFPQGSIAFLSERVPYPNSGIANTFSVRTLQDVMQFDYGAQLDPTPGSNGGPREVWDQSSIETLVNRAPVTCGVLSNIQSG